MVKLRVEVLARYVLSRVGSRDPSVLVGPAVGEDSAIIDLGGDFLLVAHVDPITGAVENIGWLSVHISSNDVAVRGARPRWLLPALYLPSWFSEREIDRVTSQIDEAARELEAMIVGGHTEYTPGLDRPMVSMTALGLVEKGGLVVTGGAKVGDLVLMTKTAGIEGTSILATDFRGELEARGVPVHVIGKASKYIKLVSVVREALALAEERLANSMHDPTEGGLLGGLTEIAYASGKTIEVWEERIPISEETRLLCRAMNVDPLKLISSGVLVATIPESLAARAVEKLEKLGVNATVIGRVKGYEGYLVELHRRSGGRELYEEPYVEDELMKLWEKPPSP